MTEVIRNFVLVLFGNNTFLGTIFISMIPVIEVRGSIPLALSSTFFQSPLSPLLTFLACIVGSTIATILMLIILKPLVNLLKKTKLFKDFSTKLETKAHTLSQKEKASKPILKYLFLTSFCALPIPLTGYYTTCLIAVFGNFKFLPSLVSIIFGNIICSGIMILFCNLAPNLINIIFYTFLFIFIATILYFVISSAISKTSKTNTKIKIDNQKH